MPKTHTPFYPIIYVRGYAMTRGEIDETTADPFCGFNLGSTVLRAVPERDRPPRKYIFESPVVRLASEYGYTDVYEDGYDIVDPEWETDANGEPTSNKLDMKSIIIYRYYDAASTLLGIGKTPTIDDFAKGLSDLIVKVRDLVCKNKDNDVTPETFRCYLVAHSMGGLVCRAMLQNPKLDPHKAHKMVDKLFTYATPHNGIDVAGINVPSGLSSLGLNNFDRDKEMPRYLNLKDAYTKYQRVDFIPEDRFPARNVFCMVGTNRLDYEAAAGLSRTFVGHGSDGLVRIENATLRGLKADGSVGSECAKAFAYRSHSGVFGIVNSEEAFQNLSRFLFGDVRADLWMDIEDIRLPEAVQKILDANKKTRINALYQIETHASPRGKLWFLTRRTAMEDSAACVTQANWQDWKSQYLSSVFLSKKARVNTRRPSLAYSMTIGVRVPDYEIDKKLWIDEHYEGVTLFRNTVIVEMVPPRSDAEKWKVKYGWQDQGVAPADQEIDAAALASGGIQVEIPFESYTIERDGTKKPSIPGIKGKLRFVISQWNA